MAQPVSFTISGCSVSGADGNYIQNGFWVTCPCYENNASGGVVVRNGPDTFWIYVPASTCTSVGGVGSLLYSKNTCDITDSGSDACDPSTTLSFSPPDIPTLSEWGLLILALLLMTLGTLVLVQPNWRGRFEQE